MKNLKHAELIGIIFTIVVGSLLHFVFEWSGRNQFVGLFSAVNESTWEHMKLLFFPYMLYAILEYLYIGKDYSNFATAKCIGVICGLALIPVLFYAYTAILGTNYFILDISIFIIAVVVSYMVSYRILVNAALNMNGICILILVLICISFFRFTFNPPDFFLFLDPASNS
ncbi:DUF6512 family protein [Hespellia stercorisuis]|uniref:Uncharacterized protein n=1 Tax=Hespellia stercorisuis DSM 15480 TaxID=1121950 RepID=A0A1M6MCB1_9FIRM|nr:DUF6512 family protein [Hespellia stercorisuis]SHJ81142.1 hypothetical protein SAMN02745243_01428 [Hespellia stercorisuis DSM 15480]